MKRYIFTLAVALVAIVASAQIKKPELMVIPSDVWCISNGYYTEVDNMGVIAKVPNYKQALQENMGLKLAIAKLNDLMAEREFPLQSLEQMIKNLEQRRMEDNMTMSKAGNELAESPLDEVARMAKCDIILELSWEMKDFQKDEDRVTLYHLDEGCYWDFSNSGKLASRALKECWVVAYRLNHIGTRAIFDDEIGAIDFTMKIIALIKA